MRFTKTTHASKRTACLYLAIRRAVALAVTNLILAICFTTTADEDFYSASNAAFQKKNTTEEETIPYPLAIPVATPEKTEKLNRDATEETIAVKKTREPFFHLYQNTKLETVCFEGTIRAISTIPDPQKNDYPNCIYALFVEVDSILSSNKASENVSSEVIVNVPIMKDNTIIEKNIFRPGDKISSICSEYDAMPQDIQEIQISDDIQSFEHMQYYALIINKVERFQTTGSRNFAKKEITFLPIQSLPKDENAKKLRSERIQSEIARIEKELLKHGGSFDTWKEEYKTISKKYEQLCAKKYKGWINGSYYSATGSETTYKTMEYIEGILPYKRFLEENNIDLIVVRIPTRYDFAARVLCSDDFQENPVWVEHYYECLKNDIEIIDPMPEMWKHRFDLPLFYYYNVELETHPFEGTYYYAASSVASALSRYEYSKEKNELRTKRVLSQEKENKYFYPSGNPKYNTTKNVEYYQVTQEEEPLKKLIPNTGSPFVFLSNSFFGRLGIADVGLPIYAAFFLQTIPDWIYQDGATGLLQDLVMHPLLLNYRRAVIMVGHPSCWKAPALFPKYYSDHPNKITFYRDIPPDQIEFSSSDFYIFSANEQNVLAKKNSNPHVSFELEIPSVPDKGTCIIRINFNSSSHCNIILTDSSTNEVLDIVETPIKSPLFVYLAVKLQEPKRVNIDISPIYEANTLFDIKNIELWYY